MTSNFDHTFSVKRTSSGQKERTYLKVIKEREQTTLKTLETHFQ